MLKTLSLNKLITLPKLKIKSTEKVYDKEWHMCFSNEEERQEFINRITRAERNIEEGRFYTQEQVDEYFF